MNQHWRLRFSIHPCSLFHLDLHLHLFIIVDMPAVPPTPFLPSRLGEGYGEESLLMAQEPIFEDQSFADNTFWTSTPRPDRRTRECSLSEDCPDIAIVKDFDSGQGIDEHASTSVRGLEMQETEFSGRGERRTWLDEQGSEASSSKSKRGVSSPDNVSESKRGKLSLRLLDNC